MHYLKATAVYKEPGNKSFFQMYSLKVDEKIKSELAKYEQDEEPDTEMCFIDIIDNNKLRLKMALDLEALAPIGTSEWGQSLLCKFLNGEQYAKIVAIDDLVQDKFGKTFKVKAFANEETFFLKLQVKDGQYKAKFDVPMDPANPDKSPITAGTQIVVFCRPGVWLNMKNGTGGVYLQIERINVEQPKKKIRAKK